MLEVQQPARLLERAVVDRRRVPHEVRRKPQRQSDERVRCEPDYSEALQLARERGGEREDDEAGRPLGGHDVLEQMNREQVVQGDRVQRRHVHRQQQDHRDVEGDLLCHGAWPAAAAPGVERDQGGDCEQHVPMQRPRMRIHGATLIVRARA